METTSKVYDNPQQAALLGYLAGIIDGEGTLRINKTTSASSLAHRKATELGAIYSPVIGVGMVDRRVPELLAEHLGGSVREERVRNGQRRSIWRWTITSRPKAIAVLQLLTPLLIVKREQAELLLDFCLKGEGFKGGSGENRLRITPDELQRREDAYLTMRKLNTVGAAATTE